MIRVTDSASGPKQKKRGAFCSMTGESKPQWDLNTLANCNISNHESEENRAANDRYSGSTGC